MQEAIRQALTRMQAMQHEDEMEFWRDVEQTAYRITVGGKTRTGMSMMMYNVQTKGVDGMFREWKNRRHWRAVEFKTDNSLVANENTVSILGTVHRLRDKDRPRHHGSAILRALAGVYEMVAHRLMHSDVLDHWASQIDPHPSKSDILRGWWYDKAFVREFINSSGDWKGASYGA